jgi:hypothetical protein
VFPSVSSFACRAKDYRSKGASMIAFIAFLAAAFVCLLKIFNVDVDDAQWWFQGLLAVGFAFAFTGIGPGGPWVRRGP